MTKQQPNDPPDLTFLKPYENQWVALSPDNTKVLASASTLSELRNALSPDQQATVGFMLVVPFDSSCLSELLSL